jgi:hypothetical protein
VQTAAKPARSSSSPTAPRKLLSETDLRVCVTRRLTVTFAGDPATGCAVHGLCGYAGTDSFEPDGIGEMDVAAYAGRGGHHRTATMVLSGVPGGPVVSAVQRTQTSGTTTACRDRQSSGGFFSLPVSGDRVTIGLAHTETAFLGTRCAGPLDADIAAALPSQTVALSRILHGSHTIDLRGSRPFAAHGLAGTVTSTLVLGHPHRAPNAGGSSRPTSPSKAKRRDTIVSYRVVHVGGRAVSTTC